MSYPKCFDSQEEFDTWVSQSDDDGLPDPRISFCESCSVTYQAQMIRAGRCQNPDFVILEEDWLDGDQIILIN